MVHSWDDTYTILNNLALAETSNIKGVRASGTEQGLWNQLGQELKQSMSGEQGCSSFFPCYKNGCGGLREHVEL
jgi:hypothetical protein